MVDPSETYHFPCKSLYRIADFLKSSFGENSEDSRNQEIRIFLHVFQHSHLKIAIFLYVFPHVDFKIAIFLYVFRRSDLKMLIFLQLGPWFHGPSRQSARWWQLLIDNYSRGFGLLAVCNFSKVLAWILSWDHCSEPSQGFLSSWAHDSLAQAGNQPDDKSSS